MKCNDKEAVFDSKECALSVNACSWRQQQRDTKHIQQHKNEQARHSTVKVRLVACSDLIRDGSCDPQVSDSRALSKGNMETCMHCMCGHPYLAASREG